MSGTIDPEDFFRVGDEDFEGIHGAPANASPREPGDDGDDIDGDTETAAALNPWESRVTAAPRAWYVDAPPKRAWLLRDTRIGRGVLPLGKVGQLIGEGGVSKTNALVQMAIAVATGTPWLGTFEPATKGRALLILGEEDAEEVQRRLYHACRAASAPTPPDGSIVALPLAGVPCPMIETDQFGNTSDAAFVHWLRSYVQANGPFALIAIDPLSRFAGHKAETDNAAATRFIQACESVAALTGATVLIAHHTNKMSRAAGQLDSTAGRGSSAFVDGARWQSALSVEHLNLDDHEERQRLGDLVTFAVTKSNYAMKPEPILLRRDVDNGGALVLLDDADRELVQRSRSGSAARTAKTSEREAERERVRDVREQQKATRRAALAAAREAEARDRNDGDDEAAHQLIEANPRATVRALVALFRKARTCGGTRAHAAIVRARREA